MTKISTFVAAVARIPVNFITEVGRDIKTLNEEAAKPKVQATEAELEEALELVRAKRKK